MSGRATTAERRAAVLRALRDRTSVDAAITAIARERWAAADAKLQARRGLCGTAAPAIGSDNAPGAAAPAKTPWWLND